MFPKIGRNEPCWCNSGKKYKKCHLGRDSQLPIPLSEIGQRYRKAFSRHLCLVPAEMKNACSGQIVRAHSVSRAACLTKIARSEHVYQIKPDLFSETRDEIANYKLVGINQASTFTGFCGRHDGEIFRSIDREEFVASSERCFLIAYRAAAHEVFKKMSSMDLLANSGGLDSGRESSEPRKFQAWQSTTSSGTSKGLEIFLFISPNLTECSSRRISPR